MASQIPKNIKIALKAVRVMDGLSPLNIQAAHLKPRVKISDLHVPLDRQTVVSFLNLRIECLGETDAGGRVIELTADTTIGDVLNYICIK